MIFHTFKSILRTLRLNTSRILTELAFQCFSNDFAFQPRHHGGLKLSYQTVAARQHAGIRGGREGTCSSWEGWTTQRSEKMREKLFVKTILDSKRVSRLVLLCYSEMLSCWALRCKIIWRNIVKEGGKILMNHWSPSWNNLRAQLQNICIFVCLVWTLMFKALYHMSNCFMFFLIISGVFFPQTNVPKQKKSFLGLPFFGRGICQRLAPPNLQRWPGSGHLREACLQGTITTWVHSPVEWWNLLANLYCQLENSVFLTNCTLWRDFV